MAWGATALAGLGLVALVMWGHDPADDLLKQALPWYWGPAWAMAVLSFAMGAVYGWAARPGWLAPTVVALLGLSVFGSGFDGHHEPSPDGDLVPLAILIAHALLAVGAALGAALRDRRDGRPDGHGPDGDGAHIL